MEAGAVRRVRSGQLGAAGVALGLCAALAAQAVRASGIDQVRELVQRAAIS